MRKFLQIIFFSSDDLNAWVAYYRNLAKFYRGLIKKLNEDIGIFKTQLRNSETQLTAKLTNFAEKKKALLKLAEINEGDRANLNKSFLELRTRLALKTTENSNLKEQVALLQQKLDKRANTDKDLDKMIAAQNDQNNELHSMQQRLAQAYGVQI